MKTKYLLFLMLLTFKLPAFAQNKIVEYCEVNCETKAFSHNNEMIIVKLVIGKVDSLFSFKDSKFKLQLQKVTSFDNRPDVLNYMTLIGCSLVSTANDQRFYFKKEFDLSELATTNNH